jgi:hypothetical protein
VSSLSLRAVARLGSRLFVIGSYVRLGDSAKLAIVDHCGLGSSLSFRVVAKIGAAVSLFDSFFVGSCLILRNVMRLAITLSVAGIGSEKAGLRVGGVLFAIGTGLVGIFVERTWPLCALWRAAFNFGRIRPRLVLYNPSAVSAHLSRSFLRCKTGAACLCKAASVSDPISQFAHPSSVQARIRGLASRILVPV